MPPRQPHRLLRPKLLAATPGQPIRRYRIRHCRQSHAIGCHYAIITQKQYCHFDTPRLPYMLSQLSPFPDVLPFSSYGCGCTAALLPHCVKNASAADIIAARAKQVMMLPICGSEAGEGAARRCCYSTVHALHSAASSSATVPDTLCAMMFDVPGGCQS